MAALKQITPEEPAASPVAGRVGAVAGNAVFADEVAGQVVAGIAHRRIHHQNPAAVVVLNQVVTDDIVLRVDAYAGNFIVPVASHAVVLNRVAFVGVAAAARIGV